MSLLIAVELLRARMYKSGMCPQWRKITVKMTINRNVKKSGTICQIAKIVEAMHFSPSSFLSYFSPPVD